jgi:hypothetical protein
MTGFELDHLFIWADVGGPEAERLVAFGLTEGAPNAHPGQGTACRRFFFRNAYLELLWVQDPAQAQSEAVAPTRLWSRWAERRSSASPFGLGLRPAQPRTGGVPFPSWEYRPVYLPAPLAIHVGRDVPLSEPFWFYLGFARRPDDPGWTTRQPLEHAAGFGEVTGVRLTGPGLGNPSEAGRSVARLAAVELGHASYPLAEIAFDGGRQGRNEDFRPVLPIVFRW